MFEDYTLEVCVDCFLYGCDYETTEEHAAAYHEFAQAGDVICPATDADGEFIEPSFSWLPCEICDSYLGGDRYSVILSRPIN